jgi:hypothetical protein
MFGSWCNGSGQRAAARRFSEAERRARAAGWDSGAEPLRTFVARELPALRPACDGLPCGSIR